MEYHPEKYANELVQKLQQQIVMMTGSGVYTLEEVGLNKAQLGTQVVDKLKSDVTIYCVANPTKTVKLAMPDLLDLVATSVNAAFAAFVPTLDSANKNIAKTLVTDLGRVDKPGEIFALPPAGPAQGQL